MRKGGFQISSSAKKVLVNKQIRAPQVRLIAEDGKQVGVVPLIEALQQAQAVGLDLVEISPQADPPVCRVMDYGKYLFEINKQKAVARKKQRQAQVKEIKLRSVTGEGDYQIKMRNAMRFLADGDKVKFTVRFRGRELMYQEQGMKLLQRVLEEVKDVAVIEQHPKMEGKQLGMVISPSKKK